MARQGRAGAALGISAIGSFVAGTLSLVALTFFAPALGAFALPLAAARCDVPYPLLAGSGFASVRMALHDVAAALAPPALCGAYVHVHVLDARLGPAAPRRADVCASVHVDARRVHKTAVARSTLSPVFDEHAAAYVGRERHLIRPQTVDGPCRRVPRHRIVRGPKFVRGGHSGHVIFAEPLSAVLRLSAMAFSKRGLYSACWTALKMSVGLVVAS
jgi:hypothetical protein